jgi:hypothetical protein
MTSMTQIEKRLSDLEAGIKEKRIGDDKVKFIEIRRLDGWIETHNIETGETTRTYNHEQDQQAS